MERLYKQKQPLLLQCVEFIKMNNGRVMSMATPSIHSMAVFGKEIVLKHTKKGVPFVNVPIFFNMYVPIVEQTSLDLYATFWGDKALWIAEEAKKDTKNNALTGGKGMKKFLIGYPYTEEYNNKKYNKFYVVEALHEEVPVFHGRGMIGEPVSLKLQKTAKGQIPTAEFSVSFKGVYPLDIGSQTVESTVTIWGDKAEWLSEQADKNNEGKGMEMEFICYCYTDGNGHTKLVVADVQYANVSKSSSTSNRTTGTGQKKPSASYKPTTPAKTKETVPPETPSFLDNEDDEYPDIDVEDLSFQDLLDEAEKKMDNGIS
ncbi:hypothetical protein IMZ31_20405 (plasmid) [Pontibacillus sp. ALD_SL1]|uniref:hypothetical protein n=1 Tax=Pontibacillus sp. ALD_SL1 TaxID=2777185 RepID=UPI001A965BE5|nr:hypothetical protein [Pontibacillus sp. ALD_SL1]QST02913.1 hypothetical protein IMZ31_20405 [Pontibacillus sp. ALD_SL1]